MPSCCDDGDGPPLAALHARHRFDDGAPRVHVLQRCRQQIVGQFGGRVGAVGIDIQVHDVRRFFLSVRLVTGALAHTRHIFLYWRALLLRYEVEALVFIEAGRAPDPLCFFWHVD